MAAVTVGAINDAHWEVAPVIVAKFVEALVNDPSAATCTHANALMFSPHGLPSTLGVNLTVSPTPLVPPPSPASTVGLRVARPGLPLRFKDVSAVRGSKMLSGRTDRLLSSRRSVVSAVLSLKRSAGRLDRLLSLSWRVVSPLRPSKSMLLRLVMESSWSFRPMYVMAAIWATVIRRQSLAPVLCIILARTSGVRSQTLPKGAV